MQSDGKMCLLNMLTGRTVRILGQAEEEMSAPPVFTEDGRMLVTAVKGLLTFWEVATGGEMARRDAHRTDIRELIVCAHGRVLTSTSHDHTALVWDLMRLATDDRPPDAAIAQVELPQLWTDLASPDAAKSRRAVEILLVAPAQAVAMLRGRLKPAPAPDANKVPSWIADLGSDDFDRRQNAERELESIVETAAAALQKAIAT